MHAWDERVFLRLGECLGVVMEVDEEAKQRRRLYMVRMLILRYPLRLPESLALEVEGVGVTVLISDEGGEDQR